ncbi:MULTISPECIES: enoyl-CoA hydratase [Halopseudomonas]|uniref:Enoyl-CoA hydratase/carnithine racemase n=1 Tax=Halopseudomonas aestusnigri TaxID=857252 RepID=A0AAQ1G6Z3_9GAMM|nr:MULTISPECIES: enoyl-CoA hydratase [Halopseudomonas]OWL89227.1 enoyl-CoA hydratase [Halopseudomonas aestusnigri]BDX20166.1 enoyl-CoA hydratase [Halopseudomonas aestusnigri]SEG06146.1 Enoyl-CoA hydratase/carnithine racemase [Halopseudomonas aestusnigri]
MTDCAKSVLLIDRPAPFVTRLTLNRPAVTNALSLELQAALSRAFTEVATDPQTRCVILTGGERVFAAGGDISSMADVGAIDILCRHTERVWAPIQHCPKPIIAAVCGYAYGGGCELAMHADIIIAGRSARFSQPEIRIGIMPGIGGTQRLVRAVGKAKAMQMALTGRPISAEEAHLAGLVSELVDDDQVAATALEQAKLIAGMPPLAAEQIKEVILAGMDASLDAALVMERKANALLFASRDQKEGMQAFLEKRRPDFQGN